MLHGHFYIQLIDKTKGKNDTTENEILERLRLLYPFYRRRRRRRRRRHHRISKRDVWICKRCCDSNVPMLKSAMGIMNAINGAVAP